MQPASLAGSNASPNCLSGTIVDAAAAALQDAHALFVVTEWKEFRTPEAICAALRTPVVFDGRNLYEPSVMAAFRLEYHCIGRAANTRL